MSRRWRALVALYVAAALVVTLQRGVFGVEHTTFRIFRQSFRHLAAGTSLYAAYPAEQGSAPVDLFKYSPTAALLYAPFAVPPYAVALFAWSLLGALLLLHALRALLPEREALLASLLVYPDLFASMQASSSNALLAALIVLAFVAMERGEQWRAAAAVAVGTALKLFPVAALTFALFHPRRRRFAAICALVAAAALLLPLVVTSPARLVQQYRWWAAIEHADADDLVFGLSAMRLLRNWIPGAWPNWPVQLAGTLLLLLPLAARRARWRDPGFRRHFLASLLAYAVLFNHQAERSTFVIGSVGVAVWCLTPPPGGRRSALRWAIALAALVGLRAAPLLLVWIVMQVELYRWPAPDEVVAAAPTRPERDAAPAVLQPADR